jgi:hypothetical protein
LDFLLLTHIAQAFLCYLFHQTSIHIVELILCFFFRGPFELRLFSGGFGHNLGFFAFLFCLKFVKMSPGADLYFSQFGWIFRRHWLRPKVLVLQGSCCR